MEANAPVINPPTNLYSSKQKCIVLLLSVVIGMLGVAAAYFFESFIALIHNISFYAAFSTHEIATAHKAESIFGIGIVVPLVIGAIIVRWLLSNYASNEKGLSVAEIMYAIHFKDSKIDPRVTLAKILASSITIGTGGSVGREGPFIQIGAFLSAVVSNLATLPAYCRGILIAAGSAAIVSATFNAPFAGVAFAVEFLLLSFNYLGLLAVIFASFTAILLKCYLVGIAPIFLDASVINKATNLSLGEDFILFIPLGIIFGIVSLLFIHAIYAAQDFSAAFIKNQYLRHAIGMTLIGIMLYLLMHYTGHYYASGIGFATIQDCLLFVIHNPWLLVLIFFAKLLATCLTLGSGASGGIFAPAIFLGATLGALCSLLLQFILPDFAFDPVLLVLVGMSATLAATTGAILTAILLVIEMTWYAHAILPLLLAASTAFIVRKLFLSDSIYTLKFTRRGISLPQWP